MKVKFFILFLFTAFLFINPVNAQFGFFSGRVIDKETNESLVGANLYVKKNMSIGSVTDFNGHFFVSAVPGDYVFTISFTGMKTLDIPVTISDGKTVNMDVEMEPFSTQFDEVIIRAGKFEKAISLEIILYGSTYFQSY